MKIIGIILTLIGLVMLIYSGFTYTTKEKVADIGPLEINKENIHHVNWPSISGVILLGAGVIILVTGRKKM